MEKARAGACLLPCLLWDWDRLSVRPAGAAGVLLVASADLMAAFSCLIGRSKSVRAVGLWQTYLLDVMSSADFGLFAN